MHGIRRADVGLHAAIERRGELALGAAKRAARDDAGADYGAREHDVELARQVGAGRQAGDRRLVDRRRLRMVRVPLHRWSSRYMTFAHSFTRHMGS